MKGEELLKIRKGLKMSRRVFAEQLGLSIRMIQYMESNARPIDTRTANAVKWIEHSNAWRKRFGPTNQPDI